MRFLQSTWCPVCIGIILTILILASLLPAAQNKLLVNSSHQEYKEGDEWIAPDDNEIPYDSTGDLIRYGKELIANTATYLGPKGIVAQLSNGMNCQNCHIDAGRQNFANPFSGVKNNYPRYRERSGRVESYEFRVNECMQRSMNGLPLDSLSLEMRAMVAYVKWIGKDVPKGIRPSGAGTKMPQLLNRAADPQKGKIIFINNCQRCHGENGQGVLSVDGVSYTYPPLWGENSYNISAGMYRLSYLAGFIKNNMPFQEATWKNPKLTDEEAWDVAAYVASQPRPQKRFTYDWSNPSKKPFDFPFGPYTDNFSEQQHKYGPFEPIQNAKAGSASFSAKQNTTGLK
ncbi:MAG TPA: c-type cytochrome [Flavisolibacter sp.]|jgi:thiosulfate dehydrogenase|nr:c-type cytochrome [Flavisolibacter sp.]